MRLGRLAAHFVSEPAIMTSRLVERLAHLSDHEPEVPLAVLECITTIRPVVAVVEVALVSTFGRAEEWLLLCRIRNPASSQQRDEGYSDDELLSGLPSHARSPSQFVSEASVRVSTIGIA